jgi:hypothetical protein
MMTRVPIKNGKIVLALQAVPLVQIHESTGSCYSGNIR